MQSPIFGLFKRHTLRHWTDLAALVAACLITSSSLASDNNRIDDAKVTDVYIHDCCGRGPYVAIALNKAVPDPLNCNAVGAKNVIATSVNSPLAQSLLNVALAAKATEATVSVWAKDACDSTRAFNEWIGISMK